MLAILKLGIESDELPEIIIEEIIQYETLTVATLTVELSAEPVSYRIGWNQGMKFIYFSFWLLLQQRFQKDQS